LKAWLANPATFWLYTVWYECTCAAPKFDSTLGDALDDGGDVDVDESEAEMAEFVCACVCTCVCVCSSLACLSTGSAPAMSCPRTFAAVTGLV
jgi:hypothetical protein